MLHSGQCNPSHAPAVRFMYWCIAILSCVRLNDDDDDDDEIAAE